MKRFLLITIILGSSALVSAQKMKFGVMFAPSLSTTRVIDELRDWDVDKDKGALRFSTGLVLDLFFQDNFAVSTGLNFATKRSTLTADSLDVDDDFAVVGENKLTPGVNLQYLQIPIGLKFYTNEVANRIQLYFQLQGNIDFRLSEKIDNNEDLTFEDNYAKIIDGGVTVGAGVEMGIGESNKVFGGITYNRGLVNIITKDFHEAINKDGVQVNNDLFSLVMGFKF